MKTPIDDFSRFASDALDYLLEVFQMKEWNSRPLEFFDRAVREMNYLAKKHRSDWEELETCFKEET